MFQYGVNMAGTGNRRNVVISPFYNQCNKDETLMSFIKRLVSEQVTSRLIRTQNRELSFRCVAYDIHEVTSLFALIMISTEPQ